VAEADYDRPLAVTSSLSGLRQISENVLSPCLHHWHGTGCQKRSGIFSRCNCLSLVSRLTCSAALPDTDILRPCNGFAILRHVINWRIYYYYYYYYRSPEPQNYTTFGPEFAVCLVPLSLFWTVSNRNNFVLKHASCVNNDICGPMWCEEACRRARTRTFFSHDVWNGWQSEYWSIPRVSKCVACLTFYNSQKVEPIFIFMAHNIPKVLTSKRVHNSPA